MRRAPSLEEKCHRICSNNCATVRVTFAQANVSSDVQTPTGVTSTSPLHLLLCTGPCSAPANVQKDVALALQPDEGHSDGGTVSVAPPDGFDAMVEMSTAWTDAALRVGNGQPVPIGSASDPPPDVTSTSDVVSKGFITSTRMRSIRASRTILRCGDGEHTRTGSFDAGTRAAENTTR